MKTLNATRKTVSMNLSKKIEIISMQFGQNNVSIFKDSIRIEYISSLIELKELKISFEELAKLSIKEIFTICDELSL